MNDKLKTKLKKVNPSCVLADHLFGINHTIRHKMIAGLILMILGVTITKLVPSYYPHPLVHAGADGIGYLLHGLGAMPYGEWLAITAGTVAGAINKIED